MRNKLITQNTTFPRKVKKELAEYFFNLALLHQNMLQGEALTNFINRSLEMVK